MDRTELEQQLACAKQNYAIANKASALKTGNTSYYVFNIETLRLWLLIPP